MTENTRSRIVACLDRLSHELDDTDQANTVQGLLRLIKGRDVKELLDGDQISSLAQAFEDAQEEKDKIIEAQEETIEAYKRKIVRAMSALF
jgi:hypothetical protein